MYLASLFREIFPHMQTEQNFSFAAHTTIGSGGYAAVAVSPENEEELVNTLSLLNREKIPYCFLGAGANVLPADGFWEGVVIRFHKLKRISVDGNRIYAGAGVTGGTLLHYTGIHSLGGFEPFAGIPMTVGGGAAMNAGIACRHFSDLVLYVDGIVDGKVYRFSLNECNYSEKNSIFLQKIAIAGVCLKGVKSDRIAQNTAEYLAKRTHLPKGRSMGCTFVNPKGTSAGEIIDGCGLKGLRVGRAHISVEHANFIINEGTSSQDISKLISIIKEEVKRQTGILLREEIRRLP